MDLQFEKPPEQGRFGNCWLIAVLNVLWSTRIDILKNLVRALPCGRIAIQLVPGTLWLWPSFPATSCQPLWAACIEKAVAHHMGGYEKMNMNRVSYACQLLLPKYSLRQIPCASNIAVISTPRGYHSQGIYELWELTIP